MTRLIRLLSGTALLLVLGATAAPALEVRFSSFPPGLSSAPGNYLAGREALKDLRTEEAATYFGGAVTADSDNPIILERAFVAYAANGEITHAANTAQHLLDIGVENELASLVIGSEALKQGRYKAVEAALSDVGGDSFVGIASSIVRAWALVGDNKYEAAQALLDETGRDGIEDFLFYHRALMAEISGRSAEALDLMSKAHGVDPNGARTVELYARLLGNAGRFDEAGKVINGFETQGAERPIIVAVRDAVAKKQRPGNFAKTVQQGSAEMFRSIGGALVREGTSDISAVFLRLGMYLAPDNDLVSMIYAQMLDATDQHEAANAIYQAIPESSPMKQSAVVRIAENLDAAGNTDEAMRRLGNIVAINPDDFNALSVLGDLQRSSKKYTEAAATYTRLIDAVEAESPAHWRYYFVRGIAYERAKEWPKAEADFKHALTLSPDEPQVLNYLGYTWVDQGTNLLAALDMIKKAVEGAPNDGYIVDSLGWAYYRLGRIDEAVEALEQAVQMRPTDPEINDHLGDAYWRAGRTLEAKFQWNVAASVDKEGEVKARVAKKLVDGLGPMEAPPSAAQAPAAPASPAAPGPQAEALPPRR